MPMQGQHKESAPKELFVNPSFNLVAAECFARQRRCRTNILRTTYDVVHKIIVSFRLESAKVRWMSTWSFCSQRGKHGKNAWDCASFPFRFNVTSNNKITAWVVVFVVVVVLLTGWLFAHNVKQREKHGTKMSSFLVLISTIHHKTTRVWKWVWIINWRK